MVAVSVIMPVYNAEKYLRRAVDSVLGQSFQDFELLLVDDGSKDASPKICDEYARQDPRVKAIHQANGGISAARNKGLENAAGDYVTFIDNDDLFLPDLLRDNYRLAAEHAADLVKYGNRYVKHKHLSKANLEAIGSCKDEAVVVLDRSNFRELYPKANEEDWLVYVWDGLFKRELLQAHGIKFDTAFKRGHEDRVFCMQIYQLIKKMVINPRVYYCHIVYPASASRVFSMDRIADTERLLQAERKLFDALQIDALHPLYWKKRIMVYMLLIFSILRKPESNMSYNEMYILIDSLKKKYGGYDCEPEDETKHSNRWKNQMYGRMFQRGQIRALVRCLLLDRKFKRLSHKITKK